MFTLYIDDSGTSPSQQVAIAGVWAPVRQWLRFESEWTNTMRREGFTCFHTSECVFSNPKSEFANWDEPKKLRVIRRLRQLIKKHVSRGWGIAIHKKDFDAAVTGEFRELVGQHHYTVAIRAMLGHVKKWRDTRPALDHFEYVFDWMQPKTDGRREEVEAVMNLAPSATNAVEAWGMLAGAYSFRKRCDVVQLQAADLLAWSHYQRAMNFYLAKPLHPIAEETLIDFERQGDWYESRYYQKDRLKQWVDDVQANGIAQRLKELHAAMKP
jgi:hypothetical protein